MTSLRRRRRRRGVEALLAARRRLFAPARRHGNAAATAGTHALAPSVLDPRPPPPTPPRTCQGQGDHPRAGGVDQSDTTMSISVFDFTFFLYFSIFIGFVRLIKLAMYQSHFDRTVVNFCPVN